MGKIRSKLIKRDGNYKFNSLKDKYYLYFDSITNFLLKAE